MRTSVNAKPDIWTVSKILAWTKDYFESHGIESPRPAAEILLAHCLKVNRVDLYIRYDQPLVQEELDAFRALIKRRIKREPVAYITGTKGFWNLELQVDQAVLIPRPETECLVEAALTVLPESSSVQKRVLDLGTGSGAIIISLALERPLSLFFATDLSFNAAYLAKANAVANGLPDVIGFFVGDWFAAIRPLQDLARFDLILSNPPYIPTQTIAELEPEVNAYEPRLALDGGKSGLDAIEQIIFNAVEYLNPGGKLMMEIGFDQKEEVKKLAKKCGHYASVKFIKDYAGIDRVAILGK